MIGFCSPRIYNTQFRIKSQIEEHRWKSVKLFLTRGLVSLKPRPFFYLTSHFPIPTEEAFWGSQDLLRIFKSKNSVLTITPKFSFSASEIHYHLGPDKLHGYSAVQ